MVNLQRHCGNTQVKYGWMCEFTQKKIIHFFFTIHGWLLGAKPKSTSSLVGCTHPILHFPYSEKGWGGQQRRHAMPSRPHTGCDWRQTDFSLTFGPLYILRTKIFRTLSEVVGTGAGFFEDPRGSLSSQRSRGGGTQHWTLKKAAQKKQIKNANNAKKKTQVAYKVLQF